MLRDRALHGDVTRKEWKDSCESRDCLAWLWILLHLGNEIRTYLLLPLILNIVLDVLSNAKGKKKRHMDWKGRNNSHYSQIT